MLQLGRRGKGEQDARCRCGRESPLPGCYDGVTGTGTTPAAFYLGLCRLRGILSPPAPHACAAGGSFYFAATKIRIGRGPLLRRGQAPLRRLFT